MDYQKIGKVTAAHGLQGELEVVLFSREKALLNAKYEYRLGEASHRLLRFREKKDRFLATFDGVSDRTQAEKLKGSLLWLHSKHLQSQSGEAIFLRELEGFQVLDQTGRLRGVISGFSSNGAQDLLIVGNFEVPFVEDLIVNLDWEKRQLHMQIPEGLEEVNQKASKP